LEVRFQAVEARLSNLENAELPKPESFNAAVLNSDLKQLSPILEGKVVSGRPSISTAGSETSKARP